MNDELEWVVPPRQERSRETLERILSAAEALLLDRGLDEVTVAEIARRAGSSVGAFYARFPDKESLLRCLFQRFYEQAVATVDVVLSAERWREGSLPTLVESIMRFVVGVFRDKRRLIVALTLRVARDPDVGAMGQRVGERIVMRMVEILRMRGEAVAHDSPEQAIGFAVWLVLGALNSRAVGGGGAAGEDPLPERLIERELSRMALAYVGISQPDRRH